MACFDLKKVIPIVCTLSLLGCFERPDTISVNSPASTSHSKQMKPGAPVKLVSAPQVFISSGEQIKVDLELEVGETIDHMEMDLAPSTGLTIIDTAAHQVLDVSTQPQIKVPVIFFASQEGRYYLNVHVRVKNDENLLSRTLALIVQVGGEQEKAVQFKKSSGENVISLPAQETISSQ